MATPADYYDQVVYDARPQAATHPDNLAAIARLYGLDPAPPPRCRVLEIGCATGGNLFGMAEAYPGSSFLGIDPSRVQIALGREAAGAIALPNLRLEAVSAADLPPDAGPFDFIICHGVYSWVPGDVREGILAACRRLLAPHGVAYVSYNAKPGWFLRLPIREMLLYHTSGLSDPAEKASQARALMQFLSSGVHGGAWAGLLRDEIDAFPARVDSYILHEYLEVENEAFYLRDFLADAGRHGLQYLSEAMFHSALGSLPEAARAVLAGTRDIVEVEQYVDFLRGRMFRRTLLVRDDAPVRRAPSPSILGRLLLSAMCRAERQVPVCTPEPELYRNDADGAIETGHPGLKAALAELCGRWPAAAPWPELWAAAAARLEAGGVAAAGLHDSTAHGMLQLFHSNLVCLHAAPSPFTLTPGERPVASRLARMQALRGSEVANLRHRKADLDPAALALLPLLDGTRDRAGLAEEMGRRGHELAPALDRLARQALLTA